MTSNYLKGRDKEYKVKHELEARGYIVTRAAGSHSPFDLIAIHPAMKQVRFIQCKPNNFSEKENSKLMKEFGWINNEFICIYEVR